MAESKTSPRSNETAFLDEIVSVSIVEMSLGEWTVSGENDDGKERWEGTYGSNEFT